MRFLHTADCHIDSPLRGLAKYEGAPVERLRLATRDAFQLLITAAIERQVDFVVIAGDLFDGRWQDMQTGIWTAGQFRRLQEAGIDVYLLRGNHDAESVVQHYIDWPDNVMVFGTDEPTSFLIEDLGVILHGHGFAQREARDDLVLRYPDAMEGCFNIGVLHTSLTGDNQHDVYAPTHPDVLVTRGYGYWALGHVHHRRVVRTDPHIVFPGNTQGRHIRECGAKGCYEVTVTNGQVEQLEFLPTDTLRWHLVSLELDAQDQVSDVLDRVRSRLAECRDESDGRLSAIRLEITGACAAHDDIHGADNYQHFEARVRDMANVFDEEVWVEKIILDTSAPVDWQRLRSGADLVGELLRIVEAAEDDDEKLRAWGLPLADLGRQAAAELAVLGIDVTDPEQLRIWVREARRLLVDGLLETTP